MWTITDTRPPYTEYRFQIGPSKATLEVDQKEVESSFSDHGTPVIVDQFLPGGSTTLTGTLLDESQYDEFMVWARKSNTVVITDYLGRRITALIERFDADRIRTPRHQWRHDFTIQALVFNVGQPA